MFPTRMVSKVQKELKMLVSLSGASVRPYSLQATQSRLPTMKIGVLSAPFAKGQPKLGVDQGPALIKNTGFLEQLKHLGVDVEDYGAVDFSGINGDVSPEFNNGSVNMQNTGIVGAANKLISESVSGILRDGRICLTLGGDHSIAIGTVHGTSQVYEDPAVLWVDAHADFNVPHTTYTGKYHGMSTGFLVKELEPYCLKSKAFSWLKAPIHGKNLAFIGLRDVDDLERKSIEMTGALAFSPKDVSAMGIEEVVKMALERICPGGKRPLHMSFDIDVLDDLEVKSTGTPVPGGLTLREGLALVEQVRQAGNLVSMDLVEVNPLIGTEEQVERTAVASQQILLQTFASSVGGFLSSRPFPPPLYS